MSWKLCNKAMQDASVVLTSMGRRIYFNQEVEQWMHDDAVCIVCHPQFGDGDWSEYVADVKPSFVITAEDVGRKVAFANGNVAIITYVNSINKCCRAGGANTYYLDGTYRDTLLPYTGHRTSITKFID